MNFWNSKERERRCTILYRLAVSDDIAFKVQRLSPVMGATRTALISAIFIFVAVMFTGCSHLRTQIHQHRMRVQREEANEYEKRLSGAGMLPNVVVDYGENLWPTRSCRVILAGQDVDLSILKGMHITELRLDRSSVTNSSSLRGMAIRTLSLRDSRISDISFISAIRRLKSLDLEGTDISDLSPLCDLRLERLCLVFTQVSDLSPLHGMPLKRLALDYTSVTDLSPLEGIALEALSLTQTSVADLSPLEGMPLEDLDLTQTSVTNLSPLKGMNTLNSLKIYGTKIVDLSPVEGLPHIEIQK